jgi:hypothetical protein
MIITLGSLPFRLFKGIAGNPPTSYKSDTCLNTSEPMVFSVPGAERRGKVEGRVRKGGWKGWALGKGGASEEGEGVWFGVGGGEGKVQNDR